MHSARFLPYLALLFSIFAITVLSSPAERQNADPEAFQELLSTASEEDLHEILHRFDRRFRDGVFHHDRTAMEAVHGEDPATATKLIKLALNKRQVSNTTSPAAPPTTPTTTSPPNAPAPTTTPTSGVSTSILAPSSPAGASAVSSTSGAIIYSNTNGELTTARTSAVLFRPTTTTLRRTTTLPDGSASTITTVEVVDAAYTTLSSAVAAETGSATNTPTLQTGGAISSRRLLEGTMVAIAGLAVVALAL